jgi:hypothetical protein
VRTGDTDDIACWFIDTDYDGQSFFTMMPQADQDALGVFFGSVRRVG